MKTYLRSSMKTRFIEQPSGHLITFLKPYTAISSPIQQPPSLFPCGCIHFRPLSHSLLLSGAVSDAHHRAGVQPRLRAVAGLAGAEAPPAAAKGTATLAGTSSIHLSTKRFTKRCYQRLGCVIPRCNLQSEITQPILRLF